MLLQPSSTTDTLEKLEDSLMTLNSLTSNRAAIPFKELLDINLKDLNSVEECLQIWLNMQSTWSYMDAVFSNDDIAKQLPEEADKFKKIDELFACTVQHAASKKSAIEACSSAAIRETFIELLDELEICQKGLSSYLGAE